MQSLPELYRRFRRWQHGPVLYGKLDGKRHYCWNCNYEYEGNFCPRCGQKASAGRITWNVVRNGIMEVFGLAGRSMFSSLWQLLWRPGYFISDYINGKWQVSFPPVKMLVILAVLVVFVGNLIYPELWHGLLGNGTTEVSKTGMADYVDSMLLWIGSHLEWAILFMLSLQIIPTWFIFRHSPRNGLHTLPQGFFIQVFITTQIILLFFIFSLLFIGSGYSDSKALLGIFLLMGIIMFVDYKQLFGYSWWGTLWRLLMIPLFLGCFFNLMVVIYAVICRWDSIMSRKLFFLTFVIFSTLVMGLLVSLVDVINRKLWREKGLWKVIRWPLVFFVATLVCGCVLEVLKPGTLSTIFMF